MAALVACPDPVPAALPTAALTINDCSAMVANACCEAAEIVPVVELNAPAVDLVPDTTAMLPPNALLMPLFLVGLTREALVTVPLTVAVVLRYDRHPMTRSSVTEDAPEGSVYDADTPLVVVPTASIGVPMVGQPVKVWISAMTCVPAAPLVNEGAPIAPDVARHQ